MTVHYSWEKSQVPFWLKIKLNKDLFKIYLE